MKVEKTELNQGIYTNCRVALNKIGVMNPKNVKQLDKKSKQILRDNSPKRLVQLAQLNCFAADKVKSELDLMFGKGKYTVVAIGRSISSIAETMGKMGVDTKIIPLSGLRRADINSIPKDDLMAYKTFLVQIGLSKTDLYKNKDKKYVLMDYTHYGRSLENAAGLLRKPEMLGDAQNLVKIPINEILGEDYNKRFFDTLFQCCRFKDYSYVGKLNYTELGKVYSKSSPDRIKEFQGNITKGLRSMFWFNVFDSLNRKNYKDVFPLDEYSAVYDHMLSPRAADNFRKRLLERNKNSIKRIIMTAAKSFL